MLKIILKTMIKIPIVVISIIFAFIWSPITILFMFLLIISPPILSVWEGKDYEYTKLVEKVEYIILTIANVPILLGSWLVKKLMEI